MSPGARRGAPGPRVGAAVASTMDGMGRDGGTPGGTVQASSSPQTSAIRGKALQALGQPQ